ncbi:MAG: isoprenylcysteine carboxylmethyltransferase family protein [Rhodospirillales bacterium]
MFPIVIIPLILFVSPVFPGDGAGLGRWFDIPMLMVGLAGQGLRVLVVGYAYIKRGGLNKRVYADKLVTRGVFGHSRNALYVGNILMIASLLLIVGNFWGYVLGGPFFIFAYIAIVSAEENFLREKFGAEYDDYCRRVNRWVPNFKGFGKSIEDMNFRWGRVVAKEYSSFSAWVLAVLAIELSQTLRAPDIGEHTGFLVFLVAVFAVSLTAFLAARIYKKSGAFKEIDAS